MAGRFNIKLIFMVGRFNTKLILDVKKFFLNTYAKTVTIILEQIFETGAISRNKEKTRTSKQKIKLWMNSYAS